MNSMKKYFAVAKVNFRCTTWIAYLITGFCVLAGISNVIMAIFFPNLSSKGVAPTNYLYLLCILMPIFIASINYTKLMNIGVKKKVFFWGSALNYIILSAAISLLTALEYYLLDKAFSIINLVGAFGWGRNIFSALFSSFAFLLLFQVVVHTLTFMQTKWYGWAADVLIVAIISVFTPIPALRQLEDAFFNLIIFARPAILQIVVCLALSACFYLTNLYYLKKRI